MFQQYRTLDTGVGNVPFSRILWKRGEAQLPGMIFLGLQPEGHIRSFSIFEFSAFQRGTLCSNISKMIWPLLNTAVCANCLSLMEQFRRNRTERDNLWPDDTDSLMCSPEPASLCRTGARAFILQSSHRARCDPRHTDFPGWTHIAQGGFMADTMGAQGGEATQLLNGRNGAQDPTCQSKIAHYSAMRVLTLDT